MIKGLCCSVSSGGPAPEPGQIAQFLRYGGTLRDVLGWHKVEKARGVYALPDAAKQLYAAVATAGGANLVTLAFGNQDAGYTPTNMSFPTMADAIAAFARYAVWVVLNVPNLAAVSIWNEMNGSFGTGTPLQRQADYAALLGVVVPAIRTANPAVKIIAGATVGWNIDGWFIHLNNLFPLAQIDFLDIHPYFGPNKLSTYAQQMARIRSAGVRNPVWFTEHGGSIADGLGTAYWPFFDALCRADIPPAGANYWLMQNAGKFHSGLLDTTGNLTNLGDTWPVDRP